MRSLGILATLELAVAVAFALPVALMGATLLLDGRLPGLAFLALAAGMVAAQQYFTRPSDVPGAVAERVVGKLVKRER